MLRAFSVTKTDDQRNEDRWHFSADGSVWAVSDGASVSYDSGPWAEVLVRRFVAEPNVSAQWLTDAVAEYERSYDREAMEWMKQAAFDRGSFATLLGGFVPTDKDSVRLFAIGDTIAALIDGSRVVSTFPYVQPEQFDSAPQLLSTSRIENRLLDDEAIADAWLEIDLSNLATPVVVLMTDAIGRWLLDEPSSDRVQTLLSFTSDQEFSDFVVSERTAGRLRRDDSTLVVVG